MRARLIALALIVLAAAAAADKFASLTPDCVALCDSEDYEAAHKCFKNDRDPPAAYLAVATCAFNAGRDSVAEEYALKSASSNREWATFINRFGYTVIYTGGLGETYTLAYVASGGARHQSKAMQYLKTSRQCRNSGDADMCAEQYFASKVAQYEQRSIQGARVSYTKGTAKGISGRVTDHYGNPIKYAKVNYKCGAADSFAYTDDFGTYTVNLSGSFDSPADLCTNGKLFVKLTYTDPKDNKVYFRVLTGGAETYVWRQLNLRSEADLRQDFSLRHPLDPALYRSPTHLLSVVDKAVMHFHMSEAVLFFKDHLKANIDYKLPVDVVSHQTAMSTCYSPATGTIFIHRSDSRYDSSERPKNREWHEFSHHVMFSLYGQWPGPESAPFNRNHNGYANPSTGDSFSEGFAEFMPLVMAEHYRYPNPSVYPVGGNLEQNWKSWSRRGFYEELAVAGVLWDIYDVTNEEGDSLQMKIEDIWAVLRPYSRDFTEIYEEFCRKYPASKEQFKSIWVLHGFFVENKTGNGIYDSDEPFQDLNRDFVKQPVEPHIDLADNGTHRYMIYEGYEKVGPATNYQRLTRRNAVIDPAGNIRVNNNVPVYMVTVKYDKHPEWDHELLVENRDGLVNVPVPDEEFSATVTVAPEGVDREPLVIRTEEFAAALASSAEQGYYLEHDFGVSNIEVAERIAERVSPGIPYWEYRESADPEDYVYREPADTGWDDKAGRNFPFWLVAVIMLLGALVLVFRQRKRRRKSVS